MQVTAAGNDARGSAPGEAVGVLFFLVGEVGLGVRTEQVEALYEYRQPAPLPKAPPHVLGLVRYGEQAVPIVDLQVFLALAATAARDDDLVRRVIVVSAAGMRVGLVCDRALAVRLVRGSELREPAAVRGGRLPELCEAEVKEAGMVVGLLHLEALVEAARMRG